MKHWRALAGAFLVLAGMAAGPARAQGLVLGPDSKPLPVRCAYALLLFQELGGFARPEARGRDNPEDLLLEVDLAAPAPAGAVWIMAAPEAFAHRPSSPAALTEVDRYWRAGITGRRGDAADSMIPLPGEPVPAAFGAPLDLPGLRAFLAGRKLGLDGETGALLDAQAKQGWRFAVAELPAGAQRLGAHLAFSSECALYPGALGALAEAGAWKLPATELLVLHSHFVNVDDNTAGVTQRFGLQRMYQDDANFAGAGGLWGRPAEDRPGRLRDSAGSLAAAAAWVQAVAPAGRFHLTVLAGAPRAAGRRDLDFLIYSHYPSAVETTSTGRAFLCLLAVSVVVILLGGYLLRRKGFAQ